MSNSLWADLALGITEDESPPDPVEWAKKKLGVHLWSKQREIVKALQDNKRVAVQSAHATGKSFLSSVLALWWVDTHPLDEVYVVTTAPSAKQVHAILWENMRRMHEKANLPGEIQMSDNWLIGRRNVGFGRKPQEYNQHSFQGIHYRYTLVILDESCGINEWLWTAVDTITTGDDCRILAIGNPDDPSSKFAQVCRPESNWHKIRISAFDTPSFTDEKEQVPSVVLNNLVTPNWVENARSDWGEGSPLWTSKVEGKFPTLDDFSTIPLSWVLDANERWIAWDEAGRPPAEYGTRKLIGVDVARFGNDKTVFAHREGEIITKLETFSKMDTTRVADLVTNRINGGSEAIVETDGQGAGVYDILKRRGQPVRGFQAGTRTSLMDASRQLGFVSLRAAAWWRMREALDPAKNPALALPPNDKLTTELTTPRWREVLGGKISIESKDEIRKRINKSTDHADAVIIAMWYSVATTNFEGAAFSWNQGTQALPELGEMALGWEHERDWMDMVENEPTDSYY